jgi:transcription-repair coupling factor (superfamily II helicase)
MRSDPEPNQASRVSVDIGLHGHLPRAYIPSDVRRMEAYRRLATADTQAKLDAVLRDLTAAYGDPPRAAQRLIELTRIRVAAAALGVRAISRRGPDIVFAAENPASVADALGRGPGTVRVVDATLAQTNSRAISGAALAEVYLRLSAAALEPGSLIPILQRRLTPADIAASPPGRAADCT